MPKQKQVESRKTSGESLREEKSNGSRHSARSPDHTSDFRLRPDVFPINTPVRIVAAGGMSGDWYGALALTGATTKKGGYSHTVIKALSPDTGELVQMPWRSESAIASARFFRDSRHSRHSQIRTERSRHHTFVKINTALLRWWYTQEHGKPSISRTAMDSLTFDPSKFYLGSQCLRGHKWNEISKSLRRLKGGNCFVCENEHNKAYWQKNREYLQRVNKQHYSCNVEYHRKRKATAAYKAYACQYAKQYRQEHKQDIEPKKRAYERERRALKANNHSFPISQQQMVDRFAVFNDSCAYCKSKGKLTIDHFIPIRHGGPNVLGNLLPACSRCNFSKQDADARIWFFQQPFSTIARWNLILRTLGKSEETYNLLPLL